MSLNDALEVFAPSKSSKYPNDVLGIKANDIIDGKDGKRKDRYSKVQKQSEMKIYEAIEKLIKMPLQEAGTNTSSYICITIPKEVQNRYKALLDMSECCEEENDPHVTIFYSPNIEGISEEGISEIIKDYQESCPELSFEVKGLTLFESDEDCVVLELEPSKTLKSWQKGIKDKILNSGATEVEITFPEWKPHMTLGYFPKGKAPNIDVDLPADSTIPFSSSYYQYGGDEGKKTTLTLHNK